MPLPFLRPAVCLRIFCQRHFYLPTLPQTWHVCGRRHELRTSQIHFTLARFLIALPMGPLAHYFKLQALPPGYFPWLRQSCSPT